MLPSNIEKSDCFESLHVFSDELLAVLTQTSFSESTADRFKDILDQFKLITEGNNDVRVVNPLSRLDQVDLNILIRIAEKCDSLPELAAYHLANRKKKLLFKICDHISSGSRATMDKDYLTKEYLYDEKYFFSHIKTYKPFDKISFEAWLIRVASRHFLRACKKPIYENIDNVDFADDEAYIELVSRQLESLSTSENALALKERNEHVEYWIKRLSDEIGLSEDDYQLFRLGILKAPWETWESIAKKNGVPSGEALRKKIERWTTKAKKWVEEQDLDKTMMGLGLFILLFLQLGPGVSTAEKTPSKKKENKKGSNRKRRATKKPKN